MRKFLTYCLFLLVGMLSVGFVVEARLAIDPYTPINTFDDASQWNWLNDGRNVTMTLSADYEDKVEGTASLRVDYSVPENGENYYAFLQWKPSGGQDWSSEEFDRITFWVKFDPGSKFYYLQYWMAGGGAGSNNRGKTFHYHEIKHLIDGNWHQLEVKKSEIDWENFKFHDFVYEIRFFIKVNNSGEVGDSGTFWLDFLSPNMALRDIEGTVSDPGVDVKYANKEVFLTSDITQYSATTDANGSFSFPAVMSGIYNLTIEEPGYTTYSKTVEVNHDSSQPISLGELHLVPLPGDKIQSFTVDSSEFTPVLGSKVNIQYKVGKPSFTKLEVLKDEEVVRVLKARSLQYPGSFDLIWDGTDDLGNVLDQGEYRLQLTAERLDETTQQITKTVAITNRMPLVYIAPENEENPQRAFELRLTAEQGTVLLFEVFDEAGNIIYSKGLTQAQSGEAVLTWEGQTQSGDMAPEAQYEFSLTVTPQGQLGQKFFGTIVVDSTPPEPVRPVLPVPGAEITNTKPELRWEGFADLYQVIYGQQEDLSDGILVTTSEPQLQITEALAPGRWYWQVLGIDLAGNVSRNNAVSTFVINSLDTTEMDLPFLQVGPNPFSPGEDGRRDELVVSYTLTRPAEVKIEVFNLAGRLIAYREALLHDPGDHIWFWNGTDSSGGLVKTGLYLLKITIKDNETLEVGERMQPIMVIR